MPGLAARRQREMRELACQGLDGGVLAYQLRRSAARRSLALRVDAAGQVVVNAPSCIAVDVIEAFILRHADWLRPRLDARSRRLDWRSGMSLPYLGQSLTLDWRDQSPARPCRVESGRMLAWAPRAEIAARVEAAYRGLARPLFAARVAEYAARMGVPVPPLRLSGARSRWGSLSATGVVRLNWRLIKAPLDLIDYVVCHELAHLRQRNHSPAFWREVAALYPGYAEARLRLRQTGAAWFEF